MINLCSMMKLSSMLLSMLYHPLLVGDLVISISNLGIDRTVMLISDHVRIQEVLCFPAMKPQ